MVDGEYWMVQLIPSIKEQPNLCFCHLLLQYLPRLGAVEGTNETMEGRFKLGLAFHGVYSMMISWWGNLLNRKKLDRTCSPFTWFHRCIRKKEGNSSGLFYDSGNNSIFFNGKLDT